MSPVPPEYRKIRKQVPKPGGPHRSRRHDLEEEDTAQQVEEWWLEVDEPLQEEEDDDADDHG